MCARLTNAFCTLHRERVSLEHWKLTHFSCYLILHLRGPMAGSSARHAEESRKDHHSQRFRLPLRLESVSATDCVSTKHDSAYAGDLRVWVGKPGGLSKLSKAPLEM